MGADNVVEEDAYVLEVLVSIAELHGHLLDDELTAVADALGNAIETTAVSLRYDEPIYAAAELLDTVS